MTRLRFALATTIACFALLAPAAQANLYMRVLQAYEANGSVPSCQFSSQQLESALKEIDTYGQQYFADFTVAVQNALAARASGACSAEAKHPASAVATSSSSLRLGPLTPATSASLPAPILAMAALAAALGLLGALAALWWWRGWDPVWAARWCHAWGDAGDRAEGTAADFDDWLRSG